ncbi:MAG: acyl transferase [Bacteroidota bacterium]
MMTDRDREYLGYVKIMMKAQRHDGFDYNDMTLELFRIQARIVPPYAKWLSYLGKDPEQVSSIYQIPFLPVELFKTETVLRQDADAGQSVLFTSSGTTGQVTSRHYVPDPEFYDINALNIFRNHYGSIEDYAVFGLLPSYLDRSGSSLIHMVHSFIRVSGYDGGGFFKDNFEAMQLGMAKAKQDGKKILLIGVTFALLQMAEQMPADFSGAVIMETGGMKGRMREMPREEVHQILCDAFKVKSIHSEYGMTELLSQAYSPGEGIFYENDCMRILLRDPADPFDIARERTRGAVNVIDLANTDSCAFIQTADLGERTGPGQFKILGRLDNSDIRGCNLLMA